MQQWICCTLRGACRHHPDINEEPSAEQDFLRIQEAYEILTHKREDSQANPNNNGWDFHDWYALLAQRAVQNLTPLCCCKPVQNN